MGILKRCYYCKKFIFKSRKFEGDYICKKCLTFVPRWTYTIRNKLEEIMNEKNK